jgi:hypothetical protein
MAYQKSGWVTFSWIVFLAAGMMNSIYGLAALGRKEYFPQSGHLYDVLQSHGWIWLVLGVTQVLVSLAIAKRSQVGLFAGLTLAVLAAVLWFFYMLYLPSSGFLLCLIYVFVIYGLAANMEEFATS